MKPHRLPIGPETESRQGVLAQVPTNLTSQLRRLPDVRHTFRSSRSGCVLLDASLSPMYFNHEAVAILAYPETSAQFLKARVGSLLNGCRSSSPPSGFLEFMSGRRRYVCRTFSLLSSAGASRSQTALAVVLERNHQRSFDSARIAEQFRLSERERETIELLVQGFTSKEIANRMRISPNTVKAFVRLSMVKMGVTTRSGLVGRVFEERLRA